MTPPYFRPGQVLTFAALSLLCVAIAFGLLYGVALSVLLLAAGALILVIGLLWASVRNLAGDSPLTLDEALSLGAPSAEEEQKRSVLRALKDLEYERSVGKISEEDYREYSNRYRAEAKRLMAQLDESLATAHQMAETLAQDRLTQAGFDPRISAATPAETPAPAPADVESEALDRASQKPEPRGPAISKTDSDEKAKQPESNRLRDSVSPQCGSCGTTNDSDARFCKRCGSALHSAPASIPSEENTP